MFNVFFIYFIHDPIHLCSSYEIKLLSIVYFLNAYCRLSIVYFLLYIAYCHFYLASILYRLLCIAYCLLTIVYVLFPFHISCCPLYTAYCSLHNAYCLLSIGNGEHIYLDRYVTGGHMIINHNIDFIPILSYFH